MNATAGIVPLLAAAAFFVRLGWLLYRIGHEDRKARHGGGDGGAPVLMGGAGEKRDSGNGWRGNLFAGDGGSGDGGGGGDGS